MHPSHMAALPGGYDPIGVVDAARILGVSRRTVHRLISTGELEALRVPGTRHGTFLLDRRAVELRAVKAAS